MLNFYFGIFVFCVCFSATIVSWRLYTTVVGTLHTAVLIVNKITGKKSTRKYAEESARLLISTMQI